MAGEFILAVDSSKLGTRAVAVGVEWDKVTTLVTELEPNDSKLDPYRKLANII
jgi:DeoR family fructose operon transcriptional repressor